MPTEVVMPQMGESITEGTLTKWLKKPGDAVERDEPLFEISTDKVDAEIPSPAAGVMGEIKIEEGATVQVGTLVCVIGEAGSAAAAPAGSAAAAGEPVATATAVDLKADSATPAAEATAAVEAAVNDAPEAPAAVGTEIAMPQMGESITEGTITKWLKNVGDTVERDEPIFEISTDKVDAEIPSPIAGKLSEIRVQEGATVTVGTIVAVIGGGRCGCFGCAEGRSCECSCGGSGASAQPSASVGETPRSSPLVRKIASENNVNLHELSGTGAAGRITKADILGHLENPQAKTSQPTTPGIAGGGFCGAAESGADGGFGGSWVGFGWLRNNSDRGLAFGGAVGSGDDVSGAGCGWGAAGGRAGADDQDAGDYCQADGGIEAYKPACAYRVQGRYDADCEAA